MIKENWLILIKHEKILITGFLNLLNKSIKVLIEKNEYKNDFECKIKMIYRIKNKMMNKVVVWDQS